MKSLSGNIITRCKFNFYIALGLAKIADGKGKFEQLPQQSFLIHDGGLTYIEFQSFRQRKLIKMWKELSPSHSGVDGNFSTKS